MALLLYSKRAKVIYKSSMAIQFYGSTPFVAGSFQA